jgi:CheY-like chemotaxis protein
VKVLVVEDELAVGAVFRDFLLELGHEAVLARSAEAALGKLEMAKPDAIILDMNLPGMSGLEFLQLRPIRESGLPVVAVSGVATEARARECLRLGAVDFVGKPVRFEACAACSRTSSLMRSSGGRRSPTFGSSAAGRRGSRWSCRSASRSTAAPSGRRTR